MSFYKKSNHITCFLKHFLHVQWTSLPELLRFCRKKLCFHDPNKKKMPSEDVRRSTKAHVKVCNHFLDRSQYLHNIAVQTFLCLFYRRSLISVVGPSSYFFELLLKLPLKHRIRNIRKKKHYMSKTFMPNLVWKQNCISVSVSAERVQFLGGFVQEGVRVGGWGYSSHRFSGPTYMNGCDGIRPGRLDRLSHYTWTMLIKYLRQIHSVYSIWQPTIF